MYLYNNVLPNECEKVLLGATYISLEYTEEIHKLKFLQLSPVQLAVVPTAHSIFVSELDNAKTYYTVNIHKNALL